MRVRPTLLISSATFSLIRFMNFSRSLLISSIESVAITRRSWPRIISCACSWTFCSLRRSSLSAARFMSTGSVEIPTVKVEGTFTRMLLSDNAPSSGMSITIGSRFKNA